MRRAFLLNIARVFTRRKEDGGSPPVIIRPEYITTDDGLNLQDESGSALTL